MAKSSDQKPSHEVPLYIPDPPSYRRLDPYEGSQDEEALVRMTYMILTREDTRREIDSLFSGSDKAHSKTRKEVEKLFVQAPIAQTSTPLLQKTSGAKSKIASKTQAFFDNREYLTEAQTLFPELLTASES